MSRSQERQTSPGGDVSCGRNRLRAIRKEPAESRLQPGLAAPQSGRVSSKRKSEHALESSVLTVPVAVGVSGGGRKLPEVLRAGEVDRIIRGVQPGSLRQQIA